MTVSRDGERDGERDDVNDKSSTDPDDPILRSMRSVWVSMRDEEPSSRGLTHLLAAARVKAEELQPKVAWWKRSFGVPLLAAATIVVMIGGGVVMKRHSDKLEVPVHANGVSSDTALAGEEHSTDPLARDQGSGTLVEPASIPSGPPAAPSAAVPQSAPIPPAEPAPRPKLPPRASTPRVETIAERAGPGQKLSGADAGPGPGPDVRVEAKESTRPPPLEGQRGEAVGGLVIARDEADANTGPGASQAVAPTRPTTDVGSIRARGATSPVEQLVKQTEVAASRADCPAVRATAARLKKLDATVYSARVAKQPAIARCLK